MRERKLIGADARLLYRAIEGMVWQLERDHAAKKPLEHSHREALEFLARYLNGAFPVLSARLHRLCEGMNG